MSSNQALITAAVLAALAMPAAAQLRFEELPRHVLPVSDLLTGSVALGDVDGDGDLDLIVGNGYHWHNGQQNRLYLNDGSGTYIDATASQMPVDNDNTQSVALGDVDGDGDLDLVVGDDGQNRLYLNNGSGTFTDATANQLPVDNDNSHSVALGDVDGDGDLDLVVGNDGQNRLCRNDGHGIFTDVTATQMPLENDVATSVVLGDVDGDGDLDLIVGNGYHWPAGQQNRLCLNNGAGAFSDATASQMPVDFDNTRSVALGDVDGDGDLDLVIGNDRTCAYQAPCYGQQSRLYVNDGTGTFTDATASQMPVESYWTSSIALGDVDADGDLDIVLGGFGMFYIAQIPLYLNNGAGTFGDVSASQMPTDNLYTSSIALGDVDGDGDLDLVVGVGTPYGQGNRLYLNLQRQLDTPVDLRIGRPYTLDAYLRYVQPSPITFALPYVSFDSASIALPPFGTIGIDPAQAVALPPIQIPQPAGVGSLNIAIVNDPGLLGLVIYSQALLVPYPHQVRLSNVVPDVLVQ